MTEPVFESMLSPIAATEDELAVDFRAELQAQGSTIANLSPYSPFFRLLTAIFSKALLALRALVLDTVLPSLFLNTAGGDALELIADGYGVERLAATAAQGEITFYRAGDTGDLPIPLGTVVESPEIGGVVYRMVTDPAGEIPDGSTSAKIAATAEAAGAAHNLGDGYYSILPTPVAGVTAVANEAGWLLSQGTDDESDDDLRLRARLQVASLGQGTFGYYKAVIADYLGITADDVFFGAYGARGFGSRDAYALLDNGNPGIALLAALNAHVAAGNHLDGDDLQVFALPGLNVNLTVTVTVDAATPQTEKDAIATGVEDRVRAMFRQTTAHSTLPRVRPNETVAFAALTDDMRTTWPKVRNVVLAPNSVTPALELPILQSLSVVVP